MRVIHKKINFEDARGWIRDIFTGDPWEHCTIIFSKKGAIRGNHYHKKTTQLTYIISGQMLVLSQKIGGRKIKKHVLKEGDFMVHKPMEMHAMIAKKATMFLAFARGLRGGKNYEKDTYRIKPGLEERLRV
ncbi:MAG: cupin domain-containing protein [bacterium]|nr:cupin domain-containing protein [bacterium]